MRCPERNAFSDLRNPLPVIRLTFLKGKFETDFIVHCAALRQRLEQWLRTDTPLGVEFGGKRPVPAFVY